MIKITRRTPSIEANKPMSKYGKGNQTCTFCYNADAIVGVSLTLINGVRGEEDNKCNPEPEISMIDLISKFNRIVKNKIKSTLID